ncbi:Hypothetical predicted protein [Olea europaea subsp. europaea]|uniref:Uncharacterized protein n=1 Tax=Olea europaea subsp. europaea TaxID=158383 RepID=A0A8S0V0Q7_OLEEU|nr:Hypothetical predicted protein [Olea europaea subsp. europaea]
MDESGCIYKVQGGALEVMKGSLVVMKGLLQKVNNQENDQNGGAGNLKEETADEAEVRRVFDWAKCNKQGKVEMIFCVQDVISKKKVEVVKVATGVGPTNLLTKINFS